MKIKNLTQASLTVLGSRAYSQTCLLISVEYHTFLNSLLNPCKLILLNPSILLQDLNKETN